MKLVSIPRNRKLITFGLLCINEHLTSFQSFRTAGVSSFGRGFWKTNLMEIMVRFAQMIDLLNYSKPALFL